MVLLGDEMMMNLISWERKSRKYIKVMITSIDQSPKTVDKFQENPKCDYLPYLS